VSKVESLLAKWETEHRDLCVQIVDLLCEKGPGMTSVNLRPKDERKNLIELSTHVLTCEADMLKSCINELKSALYD